VEQAGYTMEEGVAQYSDTFIEGSVISQSPAADTDLPEGQKITVVMSLGKEQVKNPVACNGVAQPISGFWGDALTLLLMAAVLVWVGRRSCLR